MRALSTAFGLLMVAAAAIGTRGPSLAVVAIAVAAVVVGAGSVGAATLAVGCTVVLLVLSDPPPIVAALAGLGATAYLVLRHSARVEESVSWPTVAGAVGFSAVGMAAVLIPVDVAWLPLAAPVAVLAVYLIVTRPYLAGHGELR
ncbi:hypothetical protein [Mycolicibacterium sp. 624]|uniref:hypothetical protein n=1 Tax=Mycolicibacterium sp. 624 TaxID=3156314 RepID=UPI00339AC9EA